MNNSVLVHFVGVFSEFDLYNDDILKAKLNSEFISDICHKYDTVYCIIYVKDQEEQHKFEELIATNVDLLTCKFIFVPYVKLEELLLEYPVLGSVTEYIDSNSSRLWTMHKSCPSVVCRHISYFLD
jgi:hypothetical protein